MVTPIAVARIRHAIKLTRCTQKEVAAQLEISESYLSDICTGRRSISAYVAIRLERILGIDATKLLHEQVIDELQKARDELRA